MAEIVKADGQVEFDGMQMSGRLMSQEHFQKLASLETTENDVILVGYPRCGKYWLSDDWEIYVTLVIFKIDLSSN